MSLILGVYHRARRLDLQQVQPMIDAFGAFQHRHLTPRSFPGFVVVTISELEGEHGFALQESATCVGAVAGTLFAGEQLHARAADGFWEAWQAAGAECLPELEGAFVAMAYDAEAHRLHIANDKFGMRPLFVCETAEHVAFCSEIEPLLRLPGYRFALDKATTAEYFCLGTTLDGHTFAEGIYNLAPASVLEANGDAVARRTYWEPRIAIDRSRTITEHAAHVVSVLKTIVSQMLAQLTNVRCLVSAGADTRLILSCMTEAERNSISFLTSSLAVLPIDDDRDVIGALALVERLGLQHEIKRVAFSELEFGAEYFDRMKQQRFKKVLGGWHGGEFLGGYCSKAAPIRQTPNPEDIDAKLRDTFSRRFLRDLPRHPMEGYRDAQAQLPAENGDFLFQIQQLGRAFFSNVYYGSRGSWLQPYEIVNLGFSPFWDSRFLQAMLAVPFEFVADYQLYNVIFRDVLPELTDIPTNSPLSQREDTAIPRMTSGQDPKVVLQPKYQKALDTYRRDRRTWLRHLYRWWRLRRHLRDGNALVTMQFIDFEAWWRRYVKE